MDNIEITPLHLEVRGSKGISFTEGFSTGDMSESGVEIETVWWADDNRLYGGCIDRSEAVQLRDFLNACIDKWAKEVG